MAQVGIVMGSDSDMPIMAKAADILDQLGVSYETEGKPYMIEINSIPGMSAGSIVPKQAKAMGMTLGEMFDLVIADTCRK